MHTRQHMPCWISFKFVRTRQHRCAIMMKSELYSSYAISVLLRLQVDPNVLLKCSRKFLNVDTFTLHKLFSDKDLLLSSSAPRSLPLSLSLSLSVWQKSKHWHRFRLRIFLLHIQIFKYWALRMYEKLSSFNAKAWDKTTGLRSILCFHLHFLVLFTFQFSLPTLFSSFFLFSFSHSLFLRWSKCDWI